MLLAPGAAHVELRWAGAQGSCHTLQMSDAVPAVQGTARPSPPGLRFWQFVLMFPK